MSPRVPGGFLRTSGPPGRATTALALTAPRWPPNEGFSGPYGHVAYVERVDAGGVYVSEMNVNGDRSATYRYLDATRLASAEFIHRKG